jgi:uncharacterized protein (TIGR00296 family)
MRVAVATAAPPPQLDDQAAEQQPDDPTADPTVASEAHCRFCFDALAAQLVGRPLSASASRAFADAHCALFVTWNKRQGDRHHSHHHHNTKRRSSSSSTTYHLRGCIGTLEPRPLKAALKDYALTSALRDRRFDPIVAGEVPSLKVTVSLLRRFEKAAHAQDWEVGTHGIIVSFNDPSLSLNGAGGGGAGGGGSAGVRRSATFLPEVAGEQGWTPYQAVEAAVRKAGYSGVVTAELLSSVEVTRYQSTRWEMTYGEWRRWARSGGGGGGAGGEAGALVAAVERSSSQQHHHHHHHGSGALLRALRRLLRGGAPSSAAEEEDEFEEEDEEEEE